ncbi:MAG: ABC transporter permease, partial [Bacteroidota bacterium]
MSKQNATPPQLAQRFLSWLIKDELLEEVLGDLEEQYYSRLATSSRFGAKLNYWYQVFHYLRPFALSNHFLSDLNPFFMWQHHFLINWRSLKKNKAYSIINIGGLAIGMAVAMLLGMWVKDELAYDQHHANYEEIAQVIQRRTIGVEQQIWWTMPFPMGDELVNHYNDNFVHVVKTSWKREATIEYQNEVFLKTGEHLQAGGIPMLAPKMIHGNHRGLEAPNSILISASFANILFDQDDPMGQTIQLGDNSEVQVTGVYADFPSNSSYSEVDFLASWDVFEKANEWLKEYTNNWGSNSFRLLVQKAPNTSFEQISENIQNVIAKNSADDQGTLTSKPEVFLFPMKNWYLRDQFKDGANVGGRIQYVWLFGLISVFVLFLACINFMNLSTARSEKRAREVGVRKAIDSRRGQLIAQFFSESILIVSFAFILALSIIQFSLPSFNEIANKQLSIPWSMPAFWIISLLFIVFTGLIAGSYPALFLSSFDPIKALKGGFGIGKSATIPRKVLVTVQFTVSIALIIGTLMVNQQIKFGQDRDLGYQQDHLAMLLMQEGSFHDKYETIEYALKNTGVVKEMALSTSPITRIWSTNGGLNWRGKDPELGADFPFTGVNYNYGKTVNWKIISGRDFSPDLSSDSSAIVVNEAAIKFMELDHPIGEIVERGDEQLTIIGVIEDMLIESPYQAIRPHFYYIANDRGSLVNLQLNPEVKASVAIQTIEEQFTQHLPESRFVLHFVDEVFSRKFASEERVAKLS